jgi:hypothetical protein
VEHRHLLPNEIDLLLDGDVGFGTAPLKAHVRLCTECRAELEEARALVRELEHVPRLGPSGSFGARVMAQVHVFVPWQVALLDAVRAWLPRSRPWMLVAGAGAVSVAALLTLASLWLIARLDTAVFAFELVTQRLRGALLGALSAVVGSAVGQPALDQLRARGALGLAIAAGVLVVLALGATAALRALAVGSRGRRAIHG